MTATLSLNNIPSSMQIVMAKKQLITNSSRLLSLSFVNHFSIIGFPLQVINSKVPKQENEVSFSVQLTMRVTQSEMVQLAVQDGTIRRSREVTELITHSQRQYCLGIDVVLTAYST